DPSDAETLDLCKRLRTGSEGVASPIFLITQSAPARRDIIEALLAGAWHVFTLPLDGDELRLRIALYSAPRRQTDRVLNASLVDPDTGLYNAAGIARRGRELSSDAMRQHKQLGLVAIGADVDVTMPADAPSRCGHVLREVGRLSDVV